MQTAELSQFQIEKLESVKKSAQQHGHSLEYLEGVVDWLRDYLNLSLTPSERIQYLAVVAQYPNWKLLKMEPHPQYGKSPEAIQKHLDEMQAAPETARESLGYLPAPPDQKLGSIATDMRKHFQMLAERTFKPKWFRENNEAEYLKEKAAFDLETRRLEYQSAKAMEEKYPAIRLQGYTKDKRFDEVRG